VVRVLLAEDMLMIRGALVALLRYEDDLAVVAETDRGDRIVPLALESRPDVAVIDIDLPGMDGIIAAGELGRAVPGCRSLILTSLGKPGHLRRALAAGALGFILKDAPPEHLAEAIRAVAAGDRVVDPQLALDALTLAENPLTPRERDVLRLAADGCGPVEIAHRLSLSPGTVRNSLTTLVAKLGARNRMDAVRIAEDAGWLH
jgi:two-component system response regulator DesR